MAMEILFPIHLEGGFASANYKRATAAVVAVGHWILASLALVCQAEEKHMAAHSGVCCF